MKFLGPPQQEDNITALKAELRFKILPNSPGTGWANIYHCWREGELRKLLKHLVLIYSTLPCYYHYYLLLLC